MILRTLLLEDEPDALDWLKSLLSNEHPTIQIEAEATTVQGARERLANTKVELAFLDIELPDGESFELVETLHKTDTHTIFVTAHDKYLLRALRANAVDFLQKPVDPFELKEAVNRVIKRKASTSSAPDLQAFLNQMRNNRIAVPTRNGQHYIATDNILMAQADGSYVQLFLSDRDRPLLVSRKLKEVETVLEPLGFIRASRSHLVNMDHVLEYLRIDGGTLVLTNRMEVPVSRSNRNLVTEALKHRNAFL